MRMCAVIAIAIPVSLGIASGGCRFDLPPSDPGPGPGPGEDSGLPGMDRLVIDLADVTIARSQRVRVHVAMVLADNTMQDVTSSAILESDNAAVVTSSAPGQIDGGPQSGATTITARRGDARPDSMTVVVSAKQCRPVINEFQTGGLSGADEWVEILNPCTSAIDVTNWTLVYRSASTDGSSDTSLLITLIGVLAPGEIRLYAGVDYAGTTDGIWPGAAGNLQQANGAIALRMGAQSMGEIADAVAYGAVSAAHPFVESAAIAAMVNSRPAHRQPFDGRDEDSNVMDFMQVTTGTPRAPNRP